MVCACPGEDPGLLIDATGHASEPSPQPVVATKASGTQRSSNPLAPPPALIECVTHAKHLAQSINFLPSKDPINLYLPLYGGLIVGLIYLGYTLCHFNMKGWLGRPIDGPHWSFGTSFATNFTVGTGLLSPILGGSVITDALHYITKTHYVVLSPLFAAILLIAPATDHRRPCDGRSPVSRIPELGTFLVFVVLLGGAGVGAFVAAIGVVPASFQQKDAPKQEQLVQQFNTLRNRVIAIHKHVVSLPPVPEPPDDQDMILLDRLIAREQVPARWTMF